MYLDHGPEMYLLQVSLYAFSNLMSLEIYNFWGFSPHIARKFASVLQVSRTEDPGVGHGIGF